MGLEQHITKGRVVEPRRIMLYGPEGIGKSTWASQAWSPVFLPTEDGTRDLDNVHRLPVCKTLDEFMGWLKEVHGSEHKFQTLVVDTLDWLERLVYAKVCADNKVDSIEKLPYGKGYIFALNYWRGIVDWFEAIRRKRGMTIILLAHAAIEKFSPPDSDTFNRYAPDIRANAAALIREWCDEVLFATNKVVTKAEDLGFQRNRSRGIDAGRIVHTSGSAAWVAKNRLRLPETLPLDFAAYAAYAKPTNTPHVAATTETPNTETISNGV